MNTQTPVVREYLALSSVREKLAFDPSGRPGANDVRADQERIKEKRESVKFRTQKNLGVSPFSRVGITGRTILSPHVYHNGIERPYQTPAGNHRQIDEWKNNRHQPRQLAVDKFLADLAAHREDIEQGSPRELFGLPAGAYLNVRQGYYDKIDTSIRPLGRGWFYRQMQDEYADRSYYSKSWHRQHGPKITISNRRVELRRMTKRGPECKTVEFDGWRGDWLAQAIDKAGLSPRGKNLPALKIRLNRAYNARLISEKRGYKIYQRTLVDRVIDYVIVSPLGIVYHDNERSNLVKGLHAKIRGQARKLRGVIDWVMCEKLGFCDAGIKAFCDAFSLDSRGSYTPDEIERAVRGNPADAYPFIRELKILAKSLNYQTTWH